MDPRQMVAEHIESGAGVTVAIPVPIEEAPSFGIIHADAENWIVEFLEKSKNPPLMPGDPTKSLVPMGNYVFTTEALVDIVTPLGDDSGPTDIGGDVIPAPTRAGVARMYDFSPNTIPARPITSAGTGAMSGASTPTTRRTWTCSAPRAAAQPLQQGVAGLQPAAAAAPGQARSRVGRRGCAGRTACCARFDRAGASVDRSILSPDVFADSSAVVTESILFPGSPWAMARSCTAA